MSERTTPRPDSDNETLVLGSESTIEFAAQDWLLVVEALATCAGPLPADRSPPGPNGALTRPRTQRAWELIDAIIAVIDLQPGEIANQIDDDWRGYDLGLGLDALERE